eukprot:8765761-Pyramimonas_sp.AAC.1
MENKDCLSGTMKVRAELEERPSFTSDAPLFCPTELCSPSANTRDYVSIDVWDVWVTIDRKGRRHATRNAKVR